MYYDRWNDRNREAKRQGEKDAEWGYQRHRYDYDSYSERGCAYRDGYEETRRQIERREEERRQEEDMAERYRLNRLREEAEWQRQEEEAYWEQQQEQEQPYEPECPEQI